MTLAERAQDAPGRLAFEVDGEGIGYRQLAGRASRVASALVKAGVAPGDHCAVALPTSLDFITLFYALSWMGAVPVAISPELQAREMAARLACAGCKALFSVTAVLENVANLPDAGSKAASVALLDAGTLRKHATRSPHPLHRGSADETAYLQFTSGTTGEARAAVILNRNLQASLESATSLLAFGPSDVFAGTIPLHHNFGLVRFVWAPVHAGASCHLATSSAGGVFLWLALMTHNKATTTAGPDFLYRAAARRGDPTLANLRALRVASNGGEAVHLDTIEAFERHFGVLGTVRPGYGLTEATLGVCTMAPGLPLRSLDDGTVSCGRPMPGVEVRVANEDGVELRRGTRGALLVRGPSVFAGYLGDPEGTRDVLRDGWLWTGDEAAMDADGFVYVTGRQRALIKRAGSPVLPASIERAVDQLIDVERSAAVGVPDRAAGTERIVVLAEVRDPALASRAAAAKAVARSIAAAAQAASGHQPGEIILVSPGTLPRTGSGKIKHAELRGIVERGEVERRLAVITRLGRD